MGTLDGVKILVDPGHGGDHPGTTHDGNIEKEINLAVGHKLANELASRGGWLYMTRSDDSDFGGTTSGEDINLRVDYVNDNYYPYNYDALVSLHVNTAYAGGIGAYSLDPDAGGASDEELYQSDLLASNISAAMGGYRTYTKNLAILRDTWGSAPKVLVEMETIDSDYIYDNYWQDNMAQKIANGIDNYFN
ncbi:N-acetylmuramoyl-L-alanine amidase family protein [Piscibacillus sp. B03]|uniref:N-acetylmuramoyl-L-alanine amidase family protein n=1 Tax=Piscibacillus sp. B03 TaxID=3457430 RepID=UPI003FCCFF2E